MTHHSSKSRNATILAERFKTKPCKNFIERGNCPYQFRCMFAHGDEELRTKQMNLDDGLVTEDAIRAFKTRNYNATRRAERQERRAQAHALQALEDAPSLGQVSFPPSPAAPCPTCGSHLGSKDTDGGDSADYIDEHCDSRTHSDYCEFDGEEYRAAAFARALAPRTPLSVALSAAHCACNDGAAGAAVKAPASDCGSGASSAQWCHDPYAPLQFVVCDRCDAASTPVMLAP